MATTFCRSAEACLMSQNLPASLTYAVSQKQTRKTTAAGLARVAANAPSAFPSAVCSRAPASSASPLPVSATSRGAQAATAMADQ
eukprot:scaffold64675_cov60-Phaeocystis_antarctica.AAC.2